MKGILYIKRLRVDAIIGVYAWEKQEKQPLYIDLEFEVNIERAAQTDQIQDAMDYQQLADGLRSLISQSKFQLIESVGSLAIQYLKENYNPSFARLTIIKPNALAHAEEVGIVAEIGQR